MRIRHTLFDAYYNAYTGEWLESKCSDQHCSYCRQRPAKAPIASARLLELAKDDNRLKALATEERRLLREQR